ncbi:DUF1016 N-terminal domain-containing protein [Mariniflexile sp.]|uniref:DUF1016 N-terminal domain-containing protein n=1 Tax=Mariniflexile sp. TaxID=1979402 RepID=UPI0040474CD4
MDKGFSDIINLIKQSRAKAIRVINAELIDLYWNIGKYISKKIDTAEWGDSVVLELAIHIQQNEPEIKGFSDKNIWRMKQFYEAYKNFPKLSTVLREISWSHNLAIFSSCNRTVKEFTPILSMNDKNETPKDGSLLVAKYGKGYYMYTGLSFFREFPEGVSGAYRLFANMLSIGKEDLKQNTKLSD